MSSELDLLLYRPIKNGEKFDGLIPKVKCESTDLGDGMTDYSVEKMAEWVHLYSWQMQKVAPLLEQSSLQDTCHTTHNWCHDYFQYRADTSDQLLRSPACSWAQRYEGIDCKSYSIIASSILLNLGINHYIRRIKQPGFSPDLWTHVYVVVPDNQTSGNLDQGYYVIDGTMQQNDEPMYNEKSDLYMQHYGLNGIYAEQEQGLNGILDTVKSFFSKNISIKNLSCINGSTDSKDSEAAFNLIVPWFAGAFDDFNAAVASNSPQVMKLANRLFTNAAQIKDHGFNTRAYPGWNSKCTQLALDAYKDLGVYYFNICNGAFKGYLETYFLCSYGSVTVKNNTFETPIRNTAGDGPDKNQFGRDVTIQVLTAMVLKSTANLKVVKFELTPYVLQNSATPGGVNILEMFKGLQTVVASFNTPAVTSGSGTTPNNTQNGSVVTDDVLDNSGKKTTAGGGTVGIVIGIAGLALLANAFVKSPSTGPGAKKPAATTKRKTVTKKAK